MKGVPPAAVVFTSERHKREASQWVTFGLLPLYFCEYKKAQIIAPCLITHPSYSHKISPAKNGNLFS